MLVSLVILPCLVACSSQSMLTATVFATFYASSAKHLPAAHADVIVPISTLADNSGDLISVPPAFSVSFSSLSLQIVCAHSSSVGRDRSAKCSCDLCGSHSVRQRSGRVLGKYLRLKLVREVSY